MNDFNSFHDFIRDRNITLDDIGEFSELIEPIVIDGMKGYKLRPLESTDKLRQRCQLLAFYTWHCRDYLKHVLHKQNPNKDPGAIVNAAIKTSFPAQVLSYLANAYKHDGTDHTQRWAAGIAPRIGQPFIRGQQLSFPGPVQPFLQLAGGACLGGIEIVGHVVIGDDRYDLDDFTWRHSCEIEDNKCEVIGDVVSFCNATFALWMQVLREAGFTIFPYFMPLSENDATPFARIDDRRCLCLFSSKAAVTAYIDSVPPEMRAPIRCKIFRDGQSLLTLLVENEKKLAEQGCLHLVLDLVADKPTKTTLISKFIEHLRPPT
jgi:hypothetical protein